MRVKQQHTAEQAVSLLDQHGTRDVIGPPAGLQTVLDLLGRTRPDRSLSPLAATRGIMPSPAATRVVR